MFRMLHAVLLAMAVGLNCRGTTGQNAQCSNYSTCATCIQAPAGCYWCTASIFHGPRCLRVGSQDDECPDADKENPKSSLNITKKEELSEKVQVTPTEIEATLTPGYFETFNISVRPAADYPLDIYFLMDLSASTVDDIATMRSLATDIVAAVANITSKFRLGFGSFVDKALHPFVFFWSDGLGIPFECYYNLRECVDPYSYKHVMSMTNDSQQFRNSLLNEVNSWNHDRPEGGFDGLLQVLECRDIIGWRDDARHIVIYLTDAGFHFAYDGLLTGVVRPHDGKCHLEKKNPPIYYTLYDYYDYPSVAQIYASMSKHDVVPIFACTADILHVYQNLTELLPGSAAVELNTDSSNIVDIISEEYAKTSQTVRLVYDVIPGINITVVDRMCPEGSTPDAEDPTICHNVLYNKTVVYTVSIQVTEVTKELANLEDEGVSLRIPLYSDVVLKIRTIKNCSCENNPVRGEGICSGHGEKICEQCVCDEGHTGTTCRCQGNSTTMEELVCLVGENGILCSGHGTCDCGVCLCDVQTSSEYYYGEVCECDNFNCPVDTLNRKCSGHGSCDCGQCICSNSTMSGKVYTGEICDCSPDIAGCVNPSDPLSRICSGFGQCVCESCQCQEDYFGEYCQPRYDEAVCRTVESCLECLLAFEEGVVSVSNATCNTTCNATVVTVEQNVLAEGTLRCRLTLQECFDIEYYMFTAEGIVEIVYVRDTFTDCTDQQVLSPPSWQIAIPLLIALLILGVSFILGIKLCIVLKERYDYVQWKKNRAQEHHVTMENPLYMHRNVWNSIEGNYYVGAGKTLNPLFQDNEDYLEDDVGYIFVNNGAQ